MKLTRIAPALALVGAPALADLPVSGRPVPELVSIDNLVEFFMETNEVEAGMVAIMKDGVVVYNRAFGWRDPGPGKAMSEMGAMRLASVEKPITAAAVRKLAATGAISLDDNVFDLGQWDGGILNITPHGWLGTEYLKIVTVEDLLQHKGGWDRDLINYDPMFDVVNIAAALGKPSPAGREDIASYMLGQPLQWVPGTTYAYSNFGYMLLGLIIEEVTGKSHRDYVNQVVFPSGSWVPDTEIWRGRSYKSNQSPREPWYRSPWTTQNVFDPNGPSVNSAYGGWHHEAMVGHGNMVANPVPLLHVANNYVLFGDNIGVPTSNSSMAHNGVLDGSNTDLCQRSDGIHVATLLNRRDSPQLASTLRSLVYATLDNSVTTWPTNSVDGYWVDFAKTASGQGGYHDPLAYMSTALAVCDDDTKLRMKPGSSSWTGVISKRLLIDSPLAGSTVIGL